MDGGAVVGRCDDELGTGLKDGAGVGAALQAASAATAAAAAKLRVVL